MLLMESITLLFQAGQSLLNVTWARLVVDGHKSLWTI